MENTMMTALNSDREIILNSSFEDYKKSTITRTPNVYSHYVRFEDGFWTVKSHPNLSIKEPLYLPKVKLASELFEFAYIVKDGIGKDKEERRKEGTFFISSSHGEEDIIGKLESMIPYCKEKPFRHTYVKPKQETIDVIGKGFFTNVGSYELCERRNSMTGKIEWLVLCKDKSMIGSYWIACIEEWDVPYITKVEFLYHEANEELFAFFPDEKYSDSNLDERMSYSHIGQHSACSIEYANDCRDATPEEREPLKKELEALGYLLEVLI